MAWTVREGMIVRDLDGRLLGRVTRVDPWAVEFAKGRFYRRDGAAPYSEIREVRDGEVILARSARALFELAEGRIPETWRGSEPPPLVGSEHGVVPGTATPTLLPLGPKDEFPLETTPYGRGFPPVSEAEEREYAAVRGQHPPGEPPGSAASARD